MLIDKCAFLPRALQRIVAQIMFIRAAISPATIQQISHFVLPVAVCRCHLFPLKSCLLQTPQPDGLPRHLPQPSNKALPPTAPPALLAGTLAFTTGFPAAAGRFLTAASPVEAAAACPPLAILLSMSAMPVVLVSGAAAPSAPAAPASGLGGGGGGIGMGFVCAASAGTGGQAT